MSEKIKVKTIEIQIGKKTLSLTPAELCELRDILDETFPKAVARPIVITAPIFIERPLPRPWKHWNEVWCGAESSSGATMRLESTRSERYAQ